LGLSESLNSNMTEIQELILADPLACATNASPGECGQSVD
jgi:hypothetical protein